MAITKRASTGTTWLVPFLAQNPMNGENLSIVTFAIPCRSFNYVFASAVSESELNGTPPSRQDLAIKYGLVDRQAVSRVSHL